MIGSTAPSGRPLTVGPPVGTHELFPLATPCVPKQAACRFTEKGGHFAWFGPGCAVPPPRVSPVSQTKGSTCWIAGERGDFLQKVPPFPRAPFPFQKLLPGRITGCTAPSGRPLTVGPPVGTHELFPLATPCVPKLAACRFTEKRRSFRLFLAGRHAAAASRFACFTDKRLYLLDCGGKGGLFAKSPPFPPRPLSLSKTLAGEDYRVHGPVRASPDRWSPGWDS